MAAVPRAGRLRRSPRTQKPPVEIGPDKNVKWKVAAPSGISSPIVVGDKLVLTAFDNGKLYTIAYRRADGSEAWRAEAPAKKLETYHKTEGSPAASTPATDGAAHRLLLRLVRPVLLRPRRQGAVEARDAAGVDARPISAPACRRSSSTASSCCCATR